MISCMVSGVQHSLRQADMAVRQTKIQKQNKETCESIIISSEQIMNEAFAKALAEATRVAIQAKAVAMG